MTITKTELEAIKRRCEAATDGPWNSEGSPYVFAKVPDGRPNGEGIVHCECYVRRGVTDDKANAEFIAAARTDVPELVAEVERLQEIERLWEQACDDAQDW